MRRPFESLAVKSPDTRWTLIAGLKSDDPELRRKALALLCAMYWPAVYAFLRRSGELPDAARDHTQGFFTDIVLSGGLFDRASPDRGHLRSLMCVAAKNYVKSAYRKQAVRPGECAISLHEIAEEERRYAASSAGPAEASFNRRWAVSVVEEALRRAVKHFNGRKPRHLQAFDLRIVQPSIWGTQPEPLKRVVEVCGFASESEASEAVRVVRKRVLTIIRQIVSEQVEDQGDHESEFRAVLDALQQ